MALFPPRLHQQSAHSVSPHQQRGSGGGGRSETTVLLAGRYTELP